MAHASQTRSTYPNQTCKQRQYQLMKSGRSVLPPTATYACSHTEDSYPTISSSIYSQAVQCRPYALDYNPYNALEVNEQYNAWSTAASPAIMTALQPISVIDSTVIVPQVYPILSSQQVLVPRQGPTLPNHLTGIRKRRRLYKRPCLYQHANFNSQIESDLNTSCTEAHEECLNATLLEDAEVNNSSVSNIEETNGEKKVDDFKTDGDAEAALNAYFKLPADLFHGPRKLKIIDPNEIIDQICSAEMSGQDMMWLLDLELGHPKKSPNKSFASYDVQSNMITTSDSQTSVHPGFAQCNEEFRKTLLFYYDSIISSWYLGFATYYGDYSVTRFQEWLTRVMNAYGMSWR